MSAGEGGDKPTEAAAETDAELEKKRKRTEDGKDNEQTKKQKSQENEEGDAATAPGEGQEAKGAKPPKQKKFHALKDPPAIFPHVQTLYNAFWDPSKPTEALREALQKVVETRQTILTETEEIAKREDIHAGARRRSLCRVIYDRLNCAQGQAPVSQLAADPTVQVLRKGVAKNMKQFVDHHPDWFLFGEGKSNNGKSQPTLYISPGRQHMKGPPLDEATRQYRTEMLLFKMGELLEAQGGSLPVSKLGQDIVVRELKKGIQITIVQLLKKHTDHFNLEETEITTENGQKRVLVASVVERPLEPDPMPEPDPSAPVDEEAAEGEAAQAQEEYPGQCPPWAAEWLGMMQDWWSSWESAEVQEGDAGDPAADAGPVMPDDAALDAAGAAAAAALAGMGDLLEVAPPMQPVKPAPAPMQRGPGKTLAAPMQVGPQIKRG